MTDQTALPAGTVAREREPATGKDVALALELADLGASRALVAAVGGDEALRQLDAISDRSDHADLLANSR